MRRPIRSLLIAGCLIAMTLFLIGCEEEIIIEPQGEIWLEITYNEEAANYEIEISNPDNPSASGEGTYIIKNDSPDLLPDSTPEEGTEIYIFDTLSFGTWEITVIENTISDETVENEEGGEDNLNVTDTRTRSVTIDSTTPKTVSIDFTTPEPTE